MARDRFPQALFSLCPIQPEIINDPAKAVIFDSDNERFRCELQDGTPGLSIGFHIHGPTSSTLAVLGRGPDADVRLRDSSISKIQCSLKIDLNTGVVMLYDESHRGTTQVWGDNVIPLQYGRPRQVIVYPGVNTVIGMGGRNRDLIKFRIQWHRDLVGHEDIKKYAEMAKDRVVDPRLADTVDESLTTVPSHRSTRIHTPGSAMQQVRYKAVKEIGSGSFGEVHKAINADEGSLMAVKILRRPPEKWKHNAWEQYVQTVLKREIEILSTLEHPNIVKYLNSQGYHDSNVEIFMSLKEGSLESLMMESNVDPIPIAEVSLREMLQALDYLACKGFVHRDVKPANILYSTISKGCYHFSLGDFGLSNRTNNAVTMAGTAIFMAPEIAIPQGQNRRQSPKADVWSLFVTTMWVLNVGNFRGVSNPPPANFHDTISKVASTSELSGLKEMAIVNAEQRASAAQILDKVFDGVGLTTPRNRIQSLPVCSPTTPSTAVDLVRPGLTAQSPHQRASDQLPPRMRPNSTAQNTGIHRRPLISQAPLANLLNSTQRRSRFGPRLHVPGAYPRIG